MKKLITDLLIEALQLRLSKTSVNAAPGDVSTEAKGGNTAPTVNALTIVQALSDTQETAMSPLTEYRVKATIGDINTIDDIVELEFHVYHTSDGAQSASSKWDADQCAIFKWNDTTGWSIENGVASTTWVLMSGDCIAPPVFTGTTGDWYLAFKPGELAVQDAEADWHAWVRADDENKNGTGSTVTLSSGATMAAYAEISMDTATIAFAAVGFTPADGIEPGSFGYIASPTTYLTAQVASNKTYALGSASEAPWDDGGAPLNTITLSQTATMPPLTSGQFTLVIDNETLGDPGEPKAKTQGVTTGNVTITGLNALGPTTTVDDASEGTTNSQLWMAISFATDGIDEVTYEGIITFTVTN